MHCCNTTHCASELDHKLSSTYHSCPPGLSGAELANVLNESALEAVRRDADSISTADIYNAVDRILQVRVAGVRRASCCLLQRQTWIRDASCHALFLLL